MRTSLVILAIFLSTNFARCADADRKQPDEDSLRTYMVGEYDVIGREPDSTATYTGLDCAEITISAPHSGRDD
jgi:hypothetical protein